MRIPTLLAALLALAGAAAAATPADYTGSYELAAGRVLDIGPMDEAGGQLVFVEHPALRIGVLRHTGDGDRFTAGPSLAQAEPVRVEAEFLRDSRSGSITGVSWRADGGHSEARRIAVPVVDAVAIRHGKVTLAGTLQRPASKGPHPAIVFAHGSGDATRDVGVWNAWFVRQGFAVLSLDKRGAGASTGDWHVASLDDIASDWLAGVAWLKQQRDIDPARIGVHGSSQGGWTAPRMAARSNDIAFVIVRAGSGLPVLDTMAYEVGWSVREAGFDIAQAEQAERVSRQLFALAARRASWVDIAAVQAHHADAVWREAAWPMQMSETGWSREWLALNAGFDNRDDLAAIRIPVLWFLADNDHNLPSERSAARLIESSNSDFTLVRIVDAGHGFTATATGNGNEIGSATHMASGYWDSMELWLRDRGFAPTAR